MSALKKIIIYFVFPIAFDTSLQARERVACATSLCPLLEELIKELPPPAPLLVKGANATLITQSLKGAPFDLIVSASRRLMQALQSKRPQLKIESFAKNKLVLWTQKGSSPDSYEKKELLALPNPKTTAIGLASAAALDLKELKHLKVIWSPTAAAALLAATKNSKLVAVSSLGLVNAHQLEPSYSLLQPESIQQDHIEISFAVTGVLSKNIKALVKLLKNLDQNKLSHFGLEKFSESKDL